MVPKSHTLRRLRRSAPCRVLIFRWPRKLFERVCWCVRCPGEAEQRGTRVRRTSKRREDRTLQVKGYKTQAPRSYKKDQLQKLKKVGELSARSCQTWKTRYDILIRRWMLLRRNRAEEFCVCYCVTNDIM